MLKKLEAVYQKYQDTVNLLAEPEVYSDPQRMAKLLKEQKDLSVVAGAYRAYKDCEKQAKSASELLSDPELREMAQDELREAKEAARHGLAYLHVIAPCPTGWRGAPADGFEFSRLAVETNYAPLWKARYGKFRMTHEVKEPRPIIDYLDLTKRFAHLTAEEVTKAQAFVNKRYNQIKTLTQVFGDT